MSSELEDSTATGTSIDTTGGAYWRAKLGLSGNTEQATNIITYTCDGTETGDYYFVYNSTNYQFAMPTVSSGDVIYFNTDTLKLYLLQTEIQTTTASTGTLIKMTTTPNPNYQQEIQVVKGSNNVKIFNKNTLNISNFTKTQGGVTLKVENNHITITGTGTATTFYLTSYTNLNEINANFLNKQVTFSVKKLINSGSISFAPQSIWLGSSSNNYYLQPDSSGVVTKKITQKLTLLALYILGGTYDTSFDLQFEEGSTASSFVPHQEQNYPITLPEGMELCKIGNNQDYIYKNIVDGNWYKHSEIGKFGMNTLANLFYNLTYFQSNFNSNNGIISLRLSNNLFSNLNIKNVSFKNYYNEKLKSQEGGWNSVNSKNRFSNIDGLTIWLHYTDLGLAGWTTETIPNLANKLTTCLGDTNFYLPLRTPTDTQITDTTLINQLNDIYNKLKTYQGVSHITQTNADLPFVLTLDYKKSNLLSPLTSEQKAEIVQSSVTQVETDIQPTITSIQNTANTAQSTAETAQSTANTAQNIAKGANQALSYSNYSAMVTAFNNLANNVYKVGQNVMIITLEVPDLWISSIENTSQSYTYTTDSAFTTELSTNGYVQVGYYRLSALETQKVDLINYEQNTNKVTSISSSSTNTQYPSAKAVYDYIQSLDGDEVSY